MIRPAQVIRAIIVVFSLGGSTLSVAAQEPAAATVQPPPRILPPRVGVEAGPEPLPLQRAIELALANNPDIVVAGFEAAAAKLRIEGALGAYDINVSSNSFFEHAVSPVASIIGGGANGSLTQDNVTVNAGTRGLTPWGGGSYQVDFSATRLESDNLFVTLNPQFPSVFRASYVQPLGRGFSFDAPRRQLEISRRSETLSLAVFRERALDIVARVEQAYWSLMFAQRNLDTQRQALDQARAQVESNRRMVDAGVLAPIAVVEAETQALTFEQAAYSAQDAVTRAENALKQLLLLDRSSPLWSRELQLVTSSAASAGEWDVEDAVRRALANRPELARQDAAAAIADIDIRFFEDQTRPQVDLVGTYAVAGLAGALISSGPNPITAGTIVLQERVNELSRRAGLGDLPPPSTGAAIQDFLIGGYGQSLQTLGQARFPTARLDLRFQLPIRNRTAEANLAVARVQRQQVRSQRLQAEQAIEAEVRDAIQGVRSGRGRLAAARAARTSAQEQYESERRQFEAGTSTVFLVLQRQTALVAAQAREIQAETDLETATALLRNALGDGLEHWNIRLQPD
jgi:HAE1 family hydrophobic/amphiphilic exporter-1